MPHVVHLGYVCVHRQRDAHDRSRCASVGIVPGRRGRGVRRAQGETSSWKGHGHRYSQPQTRPLRLPRHRQRRPTGKMGIHDALVVLTWVVDHFRAFQGDPEFLVGLGQGSGS
ncbi:hypothetical protein HPB48_011543 [Haemaphysalis longicornis]|uniref:Uncharacterized protein n=1 Tax=Haemaphysalis longicornis TaxID=44386 RepID=A0A9J6FZQ8_HAELO|nr:hypothetical protein HPB48_011543 [Haemaphysalis longicornis]